MSRPVVSQLQSILAHIQSTKDEVIARLVHILSSIEGIEATTCTLCYSLTFVHAQLTRLLEAQYERLALDLVSRASGQMLPGETMVATIEPPHTRLAEQCASIKALADLVTDFRMATRLWRLLRIHTWIRETIKQPPRDPIIKMLVWARLGMDTMFQTLENGSYLMSKGMLHHAEPAQQASRWSTWAYRFWAAATALELLRLARVRQLQFNEDFGAESSNKGQKVVIQSKELERRWSRDLYANAAWLPLTLHWGFGETALLHFSLSETWIGVLGTVSGFTLLRDMWTRTT